MSQGTFKHIYGPVTSWRLGKSLGVDPLSGDQKVCTFDCIYCQIGSEETSSAERRIFVSTEDIIEEIESLPQIDVDYITFSGQGEPTLAKNLGEMISRIREIRREKIAVITNSSLLRQRDVQDDLSLADLVVAKLDAPSQENFTLVNRPNNAISFSDTIAGIKEFKARFKCRLALQIMFTKENKTSAKDIAKIAQEINPDEIQLNTPLRPSQAEPLNREEMSDIKSFFINMNIISVYDVEKKQIRPISEMDTLRRRKA